MLQSKNTLRYYYRQTRRALSVSQQRQASLKILLRIARTHWFKKAKHIAFYWPSDGEISPLPLLRLAQRKNKSCYLPKIKRGNSMQFYLYQKKAKLKNNIFGIPEPRTNLNKKSLQTMDLILLPLVAFDAKGNRLGMGGGYYDRALKNARKKPARIGLAHNCQQAPQLITEPWDITLHAIATDKHFLVF